MARLRLRTQLLIATLVIICALLGSLLLIVRHTVRSEIDDGVRQSTNDSLRAFENVQQERELQLSRTAAMLAELPPLKALMTTEHALTIQDASEPLWKLAGSQLFLLAGTDGHVLGFHGTSPRWKTAVAELNLARSLEQGEDATWWYGAGQLYRVFLRPITSGTDSERRQLGILAVGYQIDANVAEQLALVAGGPIALTTGDKIIASTLSPADQAELEQLIPKRFGAGAASGELILGNQQYQTASVVIHSGPPASVKCYVLMSLQPTNAYLQRLNRMIFLLGISAVALAALLLSFVAQTITHPLDNLVSGVRALAMGNYTYSITPRGSSEVAELGEAFSKMRGELLAYQQRRFATERIAAVGRAANSISHDLRHYLAAVVANAEFLYEAEKLKLNRDEIYEEIKTASEQMVDLLDSLRELAREENSIAPIPASLNQTIRRAVDAVRTRPELRNLEISISTAGDMDGVFDPKKIERAFFNLVLNACEATVPSQGYVRIEISSSGESFEVHVADNGTGVPPAIAATLFDPFVSLGKPNGTGLGLAIVTKIVQDHGGSVTLEKTSESGTIFLVKLPRAARVESVAAQAVVS
ncbi:MAG TPA: HAMP domain-containing sensor histidine kinase [Candidatus Acidoferrales bacterium]|nr:HAMP domain-containing sensor histidine kinase [Candidatus Acidoferrales bacterium]